MNCQAFKDDLFERTINVQTIAQDFWPKYLIFLKYFEDLQIVIFVINAMIRHHTMKHLVPIKVGGLYNLNPHLSHF
jgi:hypothetical protein